MSPAPLGKPVRDKQFLLRMTAEENAYVRECAVSWEVSLNEAICKMIGAAKFRRDRYNEATPEQPEKTPQAPETPAPVKNPVRAARKAARKQLLHPPGAPAPEDPFPGQTVIPVDTKRTPPR